MDVNGLLHERAESIGAGHSAEYVSLHMSSIYYHFFGFTSGSLKNYLLEFLNGDVQQFVFLSRDFGNAWSVSNELMALGTLVARSDNSPGFVESKKLCQLLLDHSSFRDGVWISESPQYRELLIQRRQHFILAAIFIC